MTKWIGNSVVPKCFDLSPTVPYYWLWCLFTTENSKPKHLEGTGFLSLFYKMQVAWKYPPSSLGTSDYIRVSKWRQQKKMEEILSPFCNLFSSHLGWEFFSLLEEISWAFIVATVVQKQEAKNVNNVFLSLGSNNLLLWQRSILLSPSAVRKPNEEWFNKQNDWIDVTLARLRKKRVHKVQWELFLI